MRRILTADDHEVVRAGLRTMLEARSGWTVVAEAGDGRSAIVQAIELQPTSQSPTTASLSSTAWR
jgi:DNA-binding NarL/FixJ family response regulator